MSGHAGHPDAGRAVRSRIFSRAAETPGGELVALTYSQ
jgi:hypothetical protein